MVVIAINEERKQSVNVYLRRKRNHVHVDVTIIHAEDFNKYTLLSGTLVPCYLRSTFGPNGVKLVLDIEMWIFCEIGRGHIVKCKQLTNFTRFSKNRRW